MEGDKTIQVAKDIHARILEASQATGISVRRLAERFLSEGVDKFSEEYKKLFI